MSFRRDSLSALTERINSTYASLFRPLDGTPRHGLLQVFAAVDAGIYHQLLGDLDFLSRQIFPDSAEGAHLREHWSAKVPPLHAATAAGEAEMTGIAGRGVPAGILLAAASGERYHVGTSARLDSCGRALVQVRSQTPGAAANLAAGAELSIISAIPAGVDSVATVAAPGITGGADAESDEEYLARVLAALRNPARYGKPGDFAAWARDSSPEVSAAWELPNFGPLGTVLVLVVNGNQRDGVREVGGLDAVREYIRDRAPPVMFHVMSPSVVTVSPTAELPPSENSLSNRELAENRMRAWMQVEARPGARVTAGALRLAVIDGVDISDATVEFDGRTDGIVQTGPLEFPLLGEVSWR